MTKRDQWGKGVTPQRHNRDEKKQWLHRNNKDINHWIGTYTQTILSKYTVWKKLILLSWIMTGTQPLTMREGKKYTKTDNYITQWNKFLSTDSLNNIFNGSSNLNNLRYECWWYKRPFIILVALTCNCCFFNNFNKP